MKDEFEFQIERERRLTVVETDLKEIKTNHLPHLQAGLDKVLWLIVTTAVGVAVSIGLILLK